MAEKQKALPDEVSWTPEDERDANKCFQIYGEYVKKRKTVTHLAVKHFETAQIIRNRIKWAALVLKEETGDTEVVKQMADTALIDHICELDTLIDEYKEQIKARKKALKNMEPGDNPTLPKLPSMRDYTGLLREKRLALMDLARIRGVLDLKGSMTGGSPKINIYLPGGLNRGQGTESVIEEVKNTKQIEKK